MRIVEKVVISFPLVVFATLMLYNRAGAVETPPVAPVDSSPTPSPTNLIVAPQSQATDKPSAPAVQSVCSTEGISYSVPTSDPTNPVAPKGAPAAHTNGPAQKSVLATILEDRIEQCNFSIMHAPEYAKVNVKIQNGFDNELVPSCDTGPIEKNPSTTSSAILEARLYTLLSECSSYNEQLQNVGPSQAFFKAYKPTIYIIMDAGSGGATPLQANSSIGNSAGQGVKGNSQSSSKNSGSSPSTGNSGQGSTNSSNQNGSNSGAASASTGTGSIDSPAMLLMYDIAMRFSPTMINGSLPNSQETNVYFIPASSWTISNYYQQCLADPYPNQYGGGTAGLLIINGSTTTNGGSFGLVLVNGWTRAKFSASLLLCEQNTYPSVLAWHGYAEGHSFRNALSFLPLATYVDYLTTKWNASVASGSSAAADAAAVSASLGGILIPATSGLSIGDTSVTMTVPRAYDDAARYLLDQIVHSYCAPVAQATSLLCMQLSNINKESH